jgi:prepilin-type N-terminal cleavage/methylation domain-containing protein
MFKYQNKKIGGFTLVEMMVAIAVFSIVMVTAMSALLNVIDANNKARSIKTAINNISFALEGISKDMRMGTDYSCFDGNAPVTDCSGGSVGIKYKSPRADTDKFVYYKFVGTQLFECLEKGGAICNYLSGPSWGAITSTEVRLTDVTFYVLNDDSTTPEKEQPRMVMTVRGIAGPDSKPKLQTSFDLQTGVSQRIRPTATP